MKLSARLVVILAVVLCCACLAFAGDDDSQLLSQPGATFRLSAPHGPWSVIAYGDMRFTDPANTKVTTPSARRALVERIAQEHPDALLLSGDVPYSGDNANDYAVYRDETASWRKAELHVYPAMGNHELHGGASLENWWSAFPELRGRRWYSVDFGESYFIFLDSNLPLTEGSRQQQWLAGQLRSLPKQTRWLFVALHHPPVADGVALNPGHNVRPNEAALARQLEAAAPKLRARIIVAAGHIHAYERFEQNGIVYLVTGGGGATQHLIHRTPADLYQDNVYPNFHYIRFEGAKGALKATVYRLTDNNSFVVSDSFTVPAK